MFFDSTDLRRDRLWLGLSSRDLADRAGITAVRLSKLETGRASINSDDRRRLSQALSARRRELSLGSEVRFERDGAIAAA